MFGHLICDNATAHTINFVKVFAGDFGKQVICQGLWAALLIYTI
jgi:hypothetical protein